MKLKYTHLAAKNGIHRNQSQNHVLDGPIKYDMYRQRTSYIHSRHLTTKTSFGTTHLEWHQETFKKLHMPSSSNYLYILFSRIQRYKPPSHTTNSNTLYIANTAICRFITTYRGQDILVGTTRYEMDVPGWNPGEGETFRTRLDRSGLRPVSCTMGRGSLSRG